MTLLLLCCHDDREDMALVQERRSTLPIVKHLSSLVIVTHACIAHISHHWYTFFKLLLLLASKTLNFGHFWLFCHEFTHLLVPLLQA